MEISVFRPMNCGRRMPADSAVTTVSVALTADWRAVRSGSWNRWKRKKSGRN